MEQSAKTSENITSEKLQTVYAGFWTRLSAYLIDSLVMSIIILLIESFFGAGPVNVLNANSLAELNQIQAIQMKFLWIMFLLWFAYLAVFWIYYEGATPGKKLMGIKIKKVDGSSMSFLTVIIRLAGYFISTAVFALGFIWIGIDKKKQGWHDKMASTIVVHTGDNKLKSTGITLAIAFVVLMFIFNGIIFVHAFQIGLKNSNVNINNNIQFNPSNR